MTKGGTAVLVPVAEEDEELLLPAFDVDGDELVKLAPVLEMEEDGLIVLLLPLVRVGEGRLRLGENDAETDGKADWVNEGRLGVVENEAEVDGRAVTLTVTGGRVM